jgi:hypothetical protein
VQLFLVTASSVSGYNEPPNKYFSSFAQAKEHLPLEASPLYFGKGEMKKFLVLLLLTATFCFGQAPKAALTTPNAEVYVGYIATFPDYGAHLDSYRFDGGEIAFTRNLRPHWAMIGSATGAFGSTYKVKQFSGTVGPKFNLLTGPFRPYATAQVGFAYQSSNGMYAADHHPPLKSRNDDIERGLTYRAGIGADLQVSSRLYWRVVQWDTQPQPWGRHTPYYTNFSSGIGYQF